VGSLLLLLVGTAFVMTSVIDPNRYRGKIEGIVGDLSGRPFVIEGNLEITWFPWLGVRMGRAHLDNRPEVAGERRDVGGGQANGRGNRPGAGGTRPDARGVSILEWESVAVAAKVWPLLRGQVVVDRIRLQGPHVHLHRDAQGHGNWEDWGKARPGRSTAEQARVPERPLGEGGANAPGNPSLADRANTAREPSPTPQIAGIEIRDGTVDYVDEVSGLQVNLSRVELAVGEWLSGQPLPVHARFLVHTESLPAKGVWVQVDAAELAVGQEPFGFAAPKMSVKVADAQIDGGFTYEQAADAHVSARGSVAVHAPSLRKLASDLALDQTMPHDPTTLGAFELTSDWSYVDGSIAAKPLAVKLDGVNFTGWVERTAAPPAMWGFELHGDRIDLGRYINVDSANKKPFELPVAALRAINANGSLIFDQVVLADTHMADVRLRLQTAEGKP
jgi:AsmA protein